MPASKAKLWTMEVSHPGHAARLMLEHKGVDHEVVNVLPGTQPLRVRLAGFKGNTVPALEIDGRKVHGSTAISRHLDELQPEPPLFPADPERRRAVEEAERWGDEVLQNVPRRVFRWGLASQQWLRKWMADQAGIPLAGPTAALNLPIAWGFARAIGANEESARAAVTGLPATLDRVDALIADGTIGRDQPNAADFQLVASVAAIRSFADLRPKVEGRPCVELAERLGAPTIGSVPPFVPPEWL